jgi:C-terminal processing protease CtpA/Prc
MHNRAQQCDGQRVAGVGDGPATGASNRSAPPLRLAHATLHCTRDPAAETMHAGHAQDSHARPRADVAPAEQQQQAPPQQMGGVGLVFYRNSSSPYLVVKDVVHDGPAFRSSLIYPGDKLCCINDFDLAWSEKTPRSQQPQLPGAHGSSVALTFDRSMDPACPSRFTVTLMRNMGFYPGLL